MKLIQTGTILTVGTHNYVIREQIGAGGFGSVFRAECDGKSYAVKVNTNPTASHIQSIRNEFDIASKIDSIHTIRYYHLNEHEQNDYPCFIIMEYADCGNLESLYNQRKKNKIPFSNDELKDIFFQLIEGMIDISKVAVHRDIKLENILLSNTPNGVIYKLADYGISKFADADTRSPSKTMKGAKSALYYPPELWIDVGAHGQNNVKMDIYAMGIVFYWIANLRYPYKEYDEDKKIVVGDVSRMHRVSLVSSFNRSVDKVYKVMIEKMLEKAPVDRYNSWEEIHKYLSGSSVGQGYERSSLVDSMMSGQLARRDADRKKESEETEKRRQKEERFAMLLSQIKSKIYKPLREAVNEVNDNLGEDSIILTEPECDYDEEIFSFEHIVKGRDEDEDRHISFEFWALHDEPPKQPYSFYTHINGSEIDPFTQQMIGGVPNRPFEYKYFNRKILLWGTISADCNCGYSIAVLERPDDEYGELMIIEYIPNYNSMFYSFPIDRSHLKRLIERGFHDVNHKINVKPFEFEKIAFLLSLNNNAEPNSINDPLKKGRFDFF